MATKTKNTWEHAEDIFNDVAERNEICEDMLDEFRSMATIGDLASDEYDYIIQNWDNLLRKFGYME